MYTGEWIHVSYCASITIQYPHSQVITITVQWKTFEGENTHEFRGFRATRESFLHEINFGRAIPTYNVHAC